MGQVDNHEGFERQGIVVGDATRVTIGSEQITNLSSAVNLDATKYAGATHCVIQAENQIVRYSSTGTSPTATTGLFVLPNDQKALFLDLSAVKFIEAVAGAVLNVEYYRL